MPTTDEAADKPVNAFKGFNPDLTCRGFQFADGATFEHDGPLSLCNSGFHAVLAPLDVFAYYPPATSVYREVELDGVSPRQDGDSKVVARKLTIGAGVNLVGLAQAHVEYVRERIDTTKKQTKVNETASNTGARSAASNTGDYSAASNTGDYSAASNTGYGSAASNTGDYSAASNTGARSAAMPTSRLRTAGCASRSGRCSPVTPTSPRPGTSSPPSHRRTARCSTRLPTPRRGSHTPPVGPRPASCAGTGCRPGRCSNRETR